MRRGHFGRAPLDHLATCVGHLQCLLIGELWKVHGLLGVVRLTDVLKSYRLEPPQQLGHALSPRLVQRAATTQARLLA